MARADDSAWVRRTVERYQAPLIRCAAGIVGGTERAQDVVQETFLRLCREKRSRIEGHVGRWLFAVCRRRALDVRRKESRMNTSKDALLEAVPGTNPAPAAALETKEAAGKALQHLQALPPKQRQALLLKFADGLSYREIAQGMDITANYVGVLIHTGLKTLRAQLAGAPQSRSRS